MERKLLFSFSYRVVSRRMSFIRQSEPVSATGSREQANTLNQIAHRVEVRVVRDWNLGVGLRWDDCHGPFIIDGLADYRAAIGLISDDCQGCGIPVEKRVKRLAIMGLRAGDIDPKRSSEIVYSDVNLTAATAA